jgi:hypothetical protein
MEAMVCPPQAVSPIVAYNPVSIPPGWVEAYESASTELEQRNSKIGEILFITYSASNTGDSVSGNTLPLKSQYYINPEHTGSVGNPDAYLPNSNALYLLYNNVYQYYIFCPEMNTPAVLEQMTPAHFNLQPQPVASNDTDFLRGNPAIRPESQRKSWFRIYRIDPNTASDTTTGNGEKSTGDYGQFIVTCGAGGTEGYKTFGDAPNGKFLNAEFFKDLRRQERILWYRVKWSAFVGGGADMAAHYGGVNVDYTDSIGFTGGYTDIALRNRGGIFRQDKETLNRQANNRFLQRRFSSHSKRDEQSMNSSGANRTDGVSVYQTNPRVLMNTTGTISMIERLDQEPTTW